MQTRNQTITYPETKIESLKVLESFLFFNFFLLVLGLQIINVSKDNKLSSNYKIIANLITQDQTHDPLVHVGLFSTI